MTTSSTKKDTDREDLEAQVTAIKEDVGKLTRMLKEIGETKSAEARQAALSRTQDVLESGGRAVRQTRARAEQTAETVEGYIADKPLQSAMIALGVGIVLGWMSRR